MHPTKNLTIWLTALAMLSWTTLASAQNPPDPRAPMYGGNFFGVGAQLTYPFNDFGDDHSSGYGLQGLFNYPLIPLLDLSAALGWNHFPGANDGTSIDIWEMALGCRVALGAFFMNGEMGYFSKVDQWSFLPGLGLRYDHWEIALRVKAIGSDSWSSLRLGYYF